ncbi:DNA-binding response regulator [Phytohabitans suffuscus]|uniref:DNA-binding response regulator n=1 Tax=Phytohabitans suffuscus TaxID=624315 RepID=A0A6F8YAQ9_9ACTN|nr:DNA-binding response regulator [Phytohabitans suffuscus]
MATDANKTIGAVIEGGPTNLPEELRTEADAGENPTTRLLLVDDRNLSRLGVRILIERVPGFTVVGEASNAREAIRQTTALTPDVVVVDALAQSIDAGDVTTKLMACGPRRPPRVLILVNVGDQGRDALRAGATGVLSKDVTSDEFISAIRIVAAGYMVVAAQETPSLFAATLADQFVLDLEAQASLTPREMDVLQLVARGATNAEISRQLSLRESTVKSHVQHLLTKLNLPSRVHAVIYAFRTGLVEMGVPESNSPRR